MFDRKISQKADLLNYRSSFQHAQQLKQIWLAQEEPSLATQPRVSTELVRFYVCDLDGTQLSPDYDYEYGTLGWCGDPSPQSLI